MKETVECLIEDCSCLLSPEDPGDGEALLQNTSVALADEKIVAVGPSRELSGRFTAAERVSAGGRVLTPGFVDSHTHLVFAGDRSAEYLKRCQGASYEQIAAMGGGIRSTVRATREASEEELYAEARPRLMRMLALGSTTVEIKSGYGLDVESELRLLRVIRRLGEETPVRVVPTFMGAHEIPDEYREDRAGYVAEVCERMIPRVAEEGLATFCDVFCEEGVFTPQESIQILEAGKALGMAPKIHADELAASGGSEVAAQVGAVSADHLMQITNGGIDGMKQAGVIATLLPGTTFYLGKENYAPARKLLDAGLPVALATDRNPGSCTVESLQFIIGISCLRMGMTPWEAFRGATEQGARALGLEKVCGRIAPGLAADLILWETRGLERIVYEFENRIERRVWVGGKKLERKGS
ncbi:MAG: imidazolonepropionase [Planctomycetota bacterium]